MLNLGAHLFQPGVSANSTVARHNFWEPRYMFLAGYPQTNGLSVAYDYDIIIDGGKPTCLDSTVRTCRAAQFVLFIICLDLLWGARNRGRDELFSRVIVTKRIARLKRG